MSRENRMFDEMMKVARQRLADRDPTVIAKNANVAYSDGTFHFESLGIPVTVSYAGTLTETNKPNRSF